MSVFTTAAQKQFLFDEEAYSKKENQEKQLRDFAKIGDAEGIREILKYPRSRFNVNSTDSNGRSGLFIALSNGQAKQNPEVISLLLQNGAIIRNGNILKTDQVPKLLTQFANAKIIQHFFEICHEAYSSYSG